MNFEYLWLIVCLCIESCGFFYFYYKWNFIGRNSDRGINERGLFPFRPLRTVSSNDYRRMYFLFCTMMPVIITIPIKLYYHDMVELPEPFFSLFIISLMSFVMSLLLYSFSKDDVMAQKCIFASLFLYCVLSLKDVSIFYAYGCAAAISIVVVITFFIVFNLNEICLRIPRLNTTDKMLNLLVRNVTESPARLLPWVFNGRSNQAQRVAVVASFADQEMKLFAHAMELKRPDSDYMSYLSKIPATEAVIVCGLLEDDELTALSYQDLFRKLMLMNASGQEP